MGFMERWRWGQRGTAAGQTDPVLREAERATRLFGAPRSGGPADDDYAYIPPPQPKPPKPKRPSRPLSPFLVFVPGIIIGGIIGLMATIDDPAMLKSLPAELVDQARVKAGLPGGYIDCAQVRALGKGPLRRGQPGYVRRLDEDGDGVACEPYFSEAKAGNKKRKRSKQS